MTMEAEGQLTTSKKPETRAPRWRRAVVTSSVILAMLITGTGLLPTVLIHTSLRDRVLRPVAGDVAWTAVCSDASGGWLAPLVFHNVRITDPDGRFLCKIRELRTSRGLLGFLMGSPDIGQVSLIQPRVEVHITKDGEWPQRNSQSSKTQLNWVIEDGSLLITVPWRTVPIVDLEQLGMTGRIGPNAEGRRMLTVDATQIYDHESLSEEHTGQNLALIAPVLSQSTQVSGKASLWLDETQIPLDGTRKSPFPVRGHAEFHTLEARLKPAWIRQLAAMTGQITGTSLPDRVEVAKDCRVEFAVTEDGITHEGMVFLLPEIANELTITSSGIIHLDESLDLRLAVTVPKIVAGDKPILAMLAQLTSEPLQLAVKGTISHPKIQLPEGTDLLGAISSRVTPASHEEAAPHLPSAIFEILKDVQNPDKDQAVQALPGNILNLIRAIDQNSKQNPKETSGQRSRKSKRNKNP
jgi:hypothetical protein